jgi:P-type Cu+ transporter
LNVSHLLSSCVRTIEKVLSALSPPPTFVQVSIVSQSVTIHHPRDLSPTIVQSTLEDVGFDIWTNLSSDRSDVGPFNGISQAVNADRRKKHIERCSLCQQEELRVVRDPRISLGPEINSHVSRRHIAAEKLVHSNHIASAASLHEKYDVGPFRVVLSVGGMSCSSCSLTITNMVSDLQGISDVAVSLLGGSASVIVNDKRMVEVVVNTIQDCGFEAEVMSVESLAALDNDSICLRTLTLRIDGMFCQ